MPPPICGSCRVAPSHSRIRHCWMSASAFGRCRSAAWPTRRRSSSALGNGGCRRKERRRYSSSARTCGPAGYGLGTSSKAASTRSRSPTRSRSIGPISIGSAVNRLGDNRGNSRAEGAGGRGHQGHPLVHHHTLCLRRRSTARAPIRESRPTRRRISRARCSPSADVESVRGRLQAALTDVEVLTTSEFRDRSRVFWLSDTGAGAALFAGALLGIIVGTVIVAQTLYSSTKDHLNEFATLRAIGSSGATSTRSSSGRRCSAP